MNRLDFRQKLISMLNDPLKLEELQAYGEDKYAEWIADQILPMVDAEVAKAKIDEIKRIYDNASYGEYSKHDILSSMEDRLAALANTESNKEGVGNE